MRTIGLIGGMSWQSSQVYYNKLNQLVNQKLGGFHSASIILHSVNFAEYEQLQHSDDWHTIANKLIHCAQGLEKAGADCFAIATNTMHKVADAIADAVTIPLLHIADATGRAITKQQIETVGLLGTKFTMQQDFYKARLSDNFGLKVLTPELPMQDQIHQIIYNELCNGVMSNQSKNILMQSIQQLQQQGASGIILGCTELGLLVKQADTQLKIFDTTHIHIDAIVNFAL